MLFQYSQGCWKKEVAIEAETIWIIEILLLLFTNKNCHIIKIWLMIHQYETR